MPSPKFLHRRLTLLLAATFVLLPSGYFLFRLEGRRSLVTAQSETQSVDAAAKQLAWETESFSAAALSQLRKIGGLIEQSNGISVEHLTTLATAEFSCDSLRPGELDKVFERPELTVSRVRKGGPAAVRNTTAAHTGLSGFLEALQSVSSGPGDRMHLHVKFKIYRVDMHSDAAVTRADFECSGETQNGFLQQNATWMCHWVFADGVDAPQLSRIDLEEYEEVLTRAPHGHLFSDCSQAVLGHNEFVLEQFSRGVNHWKFRLQDELKLSAYGHHGLVLADVNGDGLDDVYVSQATGHPNRLFLQQSDGTATDVSASAGVDWLDRSFGALLVDIDNDGDQDLAIVMEATLMLMANDGTGTFSERAVVRVYSEDPYSLAAADYDNDGDVDLYLANYGSRPLSADSSVPGYEPPFPFHDANNGSANQLLRNDGDWRFTNITKKCGLDANNRRWSLAVSWEDYDNDGDQDLYIANDFGRNNLYRNDGGHFVDVAASAGVEDIAAGMSVSWADYNNDGWMDLYISNMFSSAGERIAYQRQFHLGADDAVRQLFQRHARGNTLFENAGNGTFHDVSVEQAVTMGRWAWGSTFFDLNNDGREDLLVANGFVTGPKTNDL